MRCSRQRPRLGLDCRDSQPTCPLHGHERPLTALRMPGCARHQPFHSKETRAEERSQAHPPPLRLDPRLATCSVVPGALAAFVRPSGASFGSRAADSGRGRLHIASSSRCSRLEHVRCFAQSRARIAAGPGLPPLLEARPALHAYSAGRPAWMRVETSRSWAQPSSGSAYYGRWMGSL